MGGGSLAGTITASEVALTQQGLSGAIATAITSGSSSSFTLTLPSDSAFTTLTGATNVTVFQQPHTTVSGTSPIASGTSIHA
jgi:H+/gluconate symporter-like permease